ncbi:MAG: hypothetical protein ACOC53_07960 [Candidatus Saliniplasma sp.]
MLNELENSLTVGNRMPKKEETNSPSLGADKKDQGSQEDELEEQVEQLQEKIEDLEQRVGNNTLHIQNGWSQ